MESVVLTGATGFIGGFLTKALHDRGFKVYPVVRASSDTSNISYLKSNFVHFDFKNPKQISEILQAIRPTYFIHNAGLTRSASQMELNTVNAEYLKNILDAISLSGVQLKKFVFVSSLAAFGPAEYSEGGIVTNSSIPHPLTMYGKSKLKAEQYLAEYADIDYVIIRPTAVYGPRERDLLTVYKVLNKGLEIIIGSKRQLLTFIYVEDLVNIIIKSLHYKNKNRAFFATDNHTYTILEYNNFIKKALGKKSVRLVIPFTIFKAIAWLSEKIGKIKGVYPPLNIDKANELAAKSWHCDMQTTTEELGYCPAINLEQGIKHTIDWCRENKWI